MILLSSVINSNCKKCPDFKNKKCDGKDMNCICKFCPRDMAACITVRWCRETESQVWFED